MYLLQNIPIIKNTNLEIRQRKIMKFIWAGKRARVKLKIMCDAYGRGGLQVPNLKLYHEAVCLSLLSKWISLQDEKLLNLEGFNKKQGWHAYLYYDKAKRKILLNIIIYVDLY